MCNDLPTKEKGYRYIISARLLQRQKTFLRNNSTLCLSLPDPQRYLDNYALLIFNARVSHDYTFIIFKIIHMHHSSVYLHTQYTQHTIIKWYVM